MIDSQLVSCLVATQFLQFRDLPVQPVELSGWDNRTFRLGKQMLVSIPSSERYAIQVEKEQKWLPRLESLLPLPIPLPVAMGEAGEGYPWRWSIYRWIEGETATSAHIADLGDFATNLAQFLIALQSIGPTNGPLPGLHNFYSGGPLTIYDTETRQAISALSNKIDINTATKIWEEALTTTWQASAIWIHGDISTGNLLVQGGKLNAVIDFGGLGIGDPACDLAITWTLFQGRSRKIFRTMLPLDAGTWTHGRAWTLWKALIIAADLPGTNTAEFTQSWRVIDEVLTDYRHN